MLAPTLRLGRLMRLASCLAVLAALSACASGPKISAVQEATQYKAHARRNYVPVGPPNDPWGPYITEASTKYDMPDRWIREVIRAESSFNVMDTSAPGAMGLMQVMPATYDELRSRYSLGDDPYEPHDNIAAGTAYLRELYDIYGSPGFLAAYNAGPGRFDDYLTRNKGLPNETRNYVAKIAPRIQGVEPNRLSPSNQFAMNQVPINIPAGPRYPHGRSQAPVALADTRRTGVTRGTVQMAALPEPPRTIPMPQPYTQAAPFQTASQSQTTARQGFRLIPQAMAETVHHPSGGPTIWAIQVGAYASEQLARSAADAARTKGQAAGQAMVGTTRVASNTLYRARVTGLSRDGAVQACDRISRTHGSCIVLSPDAQS